MTTKDQDKRTTGMSTEQLVVASHLPNADDLTVGCKPGVKMLTGMIYFILYRQVMGTTGGKEKCAEKFECGTTPFKHIITGKWQEGGGKGKSSIKTRSSRRLASQVTRQEQEGEEGTLAKKQKTERKKRAAKKRKQDDDDHDEMIGRAQASISRRLSKFLKIFQQVQGG